MIKRLRSSKALHFLARALVTLAIFWLVFHGVDSGSWHAMLQRQDWIWLGVPIGLVVCQVALGACRWRLIMAAISLNGRINITFFQALKIHYIGCFFNTCLPGAVGGDVVRVWLAKSSELPLTLAIHSVLIDRLLGLLSLCVLIVVMLPLLGKMAGFNALPFLLVIVVAGILGIGLLFYIDKILEKWRHVRPIAWLLYFASNLCMLYKRPLSSLVLLVLAVTGHIGYCLSAYALARSLGISLTMLQCIILFPPVPLAAALPISIGGWGIREAAMVAMLSLAGVTQTAALVLSVQMGLTCIAVNLPAGLLWLTHRKRIMPVLSTRHP